MKKILISLGVASALGTFLFGIYMYVVEMKEEQARQEMVVAEAQAKAAKLAEERKITQEKQRAEQHALDVATDTRTLENVRIVDGLVKKYYEKAGSVPSMVGHLSLVGQGLGFATAPRPGEEELRIREVRYTWKGGNTYELCADFKTDVLPVGVSEEWQHVSGNSCFQRSLGLSVINEIKNTL